LTSFYDLESGDVFFSNLPKQSGDSMPGFDVMRVNTDTPIENAVLSYFKMRNKKRSHA
jgi:hypothetical protein